MDSIETRAASEDACKADFRILATTDVHLHILPYAFNHAMPRDALGFARTATLIHQARAEAANTLLVDNGDTLCGLPLDYGLTLEHGADPESDTAHPMIRIMNRLGYNAATLGNHDFDNGLEFLTNALSTAQFPVVASNLEIAGSGQTPGPAFLPSAITRYGITTHGGVQAELAVGLVGLLPPRSMAKRDRNESRIACAGLTETAGAVVPRLRAAGADLIVVLAHSGIGENDDETDPDNAIVALSRVPGIDAIVAGHSHQVFPGGLHLNLAGIDNAAGTVNDVPVVCPGYWGSHLGVIDLHLAQTVKGWSVTGHSVETRPVARQTGNGRQRAIVEPDPEIATLIGPFHDRALDHARRPVGRIRTPIDSYLALVAPSSAVQVVQRAALWFLRRRCAEFIDPELPLVAAACAFRNGGMQRVDNYTAIPPGLLTMRDIDDLYPYPNEIALLRMTGAALRDWLERAASVLNRQERGTEARELISERMPGYHFDTILGVDYTIDLTRPAKFTAWGEPTGTVDAGRIRDLTHDGRRVMPDQVFYVATTNYRISGGGHYPPACLSDPVPVPPVDMREVLIAYFGAHPSLEFDIEAHWRLAAPGARVLLRTAPEMADRIAAFPGLTLHPGPGPDEHGFLPLTLTL